MTEDNRIPEIRELVARHRANVSKNAEPDELDVLLGIDPNDPVQRYANLLVRLASILDSAPPAPGPGCYPPVDGWDGVAAPRVFFPGDTVPAGVALANQLDSVLTPQTVPYVITGGPSASYIELPIPSREEWQATVDRARAERGEQP